MKKIFLLSSFFVGLLVVGKPASAQFQASINIGAQPAWGPSGYDYAENYYLPDVEAYYSVPRHQFVYNDGGNWVYASSLPGRCGNYDLYSGYKVVLNERDPWMHFNNHRAQYANYRYRHDQVVIRDYRNYDRGNYNRGGFNNRNNNYGRDMGYNNNRRFNDRRDGDNRGGYDNHRNQEDNHDRRGHGRW